VTRWAEVASFGREDEARLLAGRLQAEGIEARVYPEFQGGYYGESVNIPVQVLVPEHRALEARAVMERLEQA
jgi:Putative prokaryotic signal transducing protein